MAELPDRIESASSSRPDVERRLRMEGVSAEQSLHVMKRVKRPEHPGIIPVLAAGEAERFSYVVTPLLGGETLREFAAALKRALRLLKPEYRRCFTLRHKSADRTNRDRTERLEPPGQGRVIRNWDVQFAL